MARDHTGVALSTYGMGNPTGPIDMTGTGLTIATWIRPDVLPAAVGMIVNKAVAGSNDGYGLGHTSAKPIVRVGNGGVQSATGATTITTGVWHHLAGTMSGTGASALRVYLDGNQDGTGSAAAAMPDTAADFNIGGFSGNVQMFDGRVAETCLWNVALTAAEILALAKGVSPLLVRPKNIVGYWPFYGVPPTTNAAEQDFSDYGQVVTTPGSVGPADHAPVGPSVPIAY